MKTIINNNIKKHPVVGKKNISMLALWERKNSEKRDCLVSRPWRSSVQRREFAPREVSTSGKLMGGIP